MENGQDIDVSSYAYGLPPSLFEVKYDGGLGFSEARLVFSQNGMLGICVMRPHNSWYVCSTLD